MLDFQKQSSNAPVVPGDREYCAASLKLVSDDHSSIVPLIIHVVV